MYLLIRSRGRRHVVGSHGRRKRGVRVDGGRRAERRLFIVGHLGRALKELEMEMSSREDGGRREIWSASAVGQ